MRKIILIFVALMMMIAQPSTGQTRDYNDLYRSLASMRDFEAYWALFQYLQRTTSRDFANANAYYQAALIMQKLMRESDPFLDTRNVQNYIEQAELYFGLSKRAMEEREFRRQSDFYPTVTPAGQRLTMEDVLRDIDERLEDLEEFKKRFNESLTYLVNSVNFYNNCITTFAEINQENSRLNDLYFLVDDQLSRKLNELGADFDSTIFNLDRLKASLEQYPLGDYKINYSLRQIPVYRLYGLNSSNFLAENVALWDFRSWVDDFHEILDTDIAFLYNNVQEANSTNTAYITRLLNMNTRDIPQQYRMNPLIVNKILKYDFNSATAALLSYQEAKVNYLYSIADNRTGNDLAAFTQFSSSPDAFLFSALEKQKADELLVDAKSKATPESIKKYEKFYQDSYRGFSGYERYLNQQADENEAVMRNALNAYKDRVLRSYIRTGAERTVTHNGRPLVFQVTTPNLLPEETGYYIHSIEQLSDRRMLIAGTHVADNQKTAFAALSDSVGTVQWLREYRQQNADSHAMLTAVVNEGFAIVVASPEGNTIRNRMMLLDPANGNARTTKDLPFQSVPQQLVYDDIAQTYVLAFKGSSFMPFAASNDILHVAMLDARLETVWSESVALDGYIANVIKTDDNYYIYGAYRRITDAAGRQFATQANHMNMFVYPINATGRWLNVTAFDAPFSYYPLNVVKINNEYVDVISIVDEQPDRLIEGRALGGSPYYKVIHSNSEVFYVYN